MIPITKKTFHALIKKIEHSRQDDNKFSKNITLLNYIYINARYRSIIRIKPTT